MKKMLLFSITVSVCFLTLPVWSAVSGDYEYTDNGDTTCTITDYYGSGGDVTIPDTLNGLTVTTIGDYAFLNCSSLTSVVIPDSVTTIGGGAQEAMYSCQFPIKPHRKQKFLKVQGDLGKIVTSKGLNYIF